METVLLPVVAHPPTLIQIDFVDDRGLRLVVEERTSRSLDPALDGPATILREITAGQGDHTYEIVWEVVVCFAVRGDPFPMGGQSRETISQGDPASPFMNWVQATCHAAPDYVEAMNGRPISPPPPLQHWLISTTEGLIDVATTRPPTVSRLGSAKVR